MTKTLPVASTADYPAETKRHEAEEMRMKAKYALEDIERAETHKKDKELMKHVKKAAKEKIKTMNKIC